MKNQRKKSKSPSELLSIDDCLNALYKELERTFPVPATKTVPKRAEDHLKRKEKAEKSLQKYKQIEKLLLDAGSKKFLEVTFTDPDVRQLQYNNIRHHSHYNNTSTGSPTLPSVSFSPITESGARYATYDQDQRSKVRALFDVLLASFDSKKLLNLTINEPIGKQIHVCSKIDPQPCFNRLSASSLQIATRYDNPEAVKLLLEIAVKQFTPLTKRKKKDDTFVPTINNHELLKLLNQNIKPGDYLDSSGKSIYRADDYEDDPNEKPIQLNCTTSPSTFILYSSSGFNVAHIASYYNSLNSLKTIIDTIEKEKILYFRIIDEDDKKAETDTSSAALINDLITSGPGNKSGYYNRSNITLTPLEVAIARGNKEICKFLIEKGGLKIITEEDLPEIYTGLDVGGQKMDWALDHHATDDSQDNKHYAIMIATYFNQPEIIEFLVSDAPTIWRNYYSSTFPDRELPEIPDELKLSCKKFSKKLTSYTPLHVCCFWVKNGAKKNNNHYYYNRNTHQDQSIKGSGTRINAATKILELDEKLNNSTLINSKTKDGLTALMISSYFNVVDIVSLLLSKKSLIQVDSQCSKRGWTALHYAAYNNCTNAATELLHSFSNAQCDLKSNDFLQTPLTVAVIRKHFDITKVFVDSGKFNVFAKDVGGDFALHHAIRAGKLDIVKLLLSAAPQDSNDYLQENGINQTVLDVAILNLLKHLREQNVRNEQTSTAALILHEVYNHLGYERSLSQYKFIRSVTDIMIQQTIVQCEIDLKNKKVDRWSAPPPDKDTWSHTCFIAELSSISLPSPIADELMVPLNQLTTRKYQDLY